MTSRLCAVLGNQQEKFKTVRNCEVKAPMDYVIVTGWQANNESYLSFRRRWKLTQTRVCRAEAWVNVIVNGASDKAVRVHGRVLCEGNPVMEVQLAFSSVVASRTRRAVFFTYTF